VWIHVRSGVGVGCLYVDSVLWRVVLSSLSERTAVVNIPWSTANWRRAISVILLGQG
jgi:hypothetical protein